MEIRVLQTMRPKSGFSISLDWPHIGKLIMTSQFADLTLSSKLFDIDVSLLSRLVTDPSFMLVSLLVLDLIQFFFVKD